MTFPENEDTPPSKKLKLDEAVTAREPTASEEKNILHFCDDILLEILSYLRPFDLYSLSQCCQRFQRITCDRTLWEHVDLRSPRLRKRDIEVFVNYLLPSTRSLATRGTWDPPSEVWDGESEQQHLALLPYEQPTISEEILVKTKQKSPHITCFVFEDHVFDCDDIKFNMIWANLPSGLEELALRRCYLSNCQKHKAFFSGIYDSLPKLKRLDLSGCTWFQPHSFLALSKCKHLEELRVADCHLTDFVPYVSLGTRFGFQALSILDLRRTWVSDREVACFDKTTTLRELYLESPGGRRGPYLISDLATTSFGGTMDEWNKMGYIVMFMEHFEGFKPSSLSVITLCNYKTVSDTSLRHCASCLKGLTRLDVTGTSCSLKGVIDFKAKRPDVHITSSFDSEVEVASGSNEEET